MRPMRSSGFRLASSSRAFFRRLPGRGRYGVNFARLLERLKAPRRVADPPGPHPPFHPPIPNQGPDHGR